MITVKAYANCDHAYVVWVADKPIPDCLGFALYRQPPGGEAEVVDTFVGPKTEEKIPAGTNRFPNPAALTTFRIFLPNQYSHLFFSASSRYPLSIHDMRFKLGQSSKVRILKRHRELSDGVFRLHSLSLLSAAARKSLVGSRRVAGFSQSSS